SRGPPLPAPRPPRSRGPVPAPAAPTAASPPSAPGLKLHRERGRLGSAGVFGAETRSEREHSRVGEPQHSPALPVCFSALSGAFSGGRIRISVCGRGAATSPCGPAGLGGGSDILRGGGGVSYTVFRRGLERASYL